MKRVIKVGIFLCLFFFLGVFLLNHFGYSRQPEREIPFPVSGIWHCDDLGITLFLDEGKCTFEDGENTIICSMLRERASRDVYIYCNETSNLDYKYNQLFFSGVFTGIDGDVLYIKEHKTGKEFCFFHIGK